MGHRQRLWCGLLVLGATLVASTAVAQAAVVAGVLRDETGGALPGVSVELRPSAGSPLLAVTDGQGAFRFDQVAAGHYQASFALINFAGARREFDVTASGSVRLDVVLHLALSADVTVTGKRIFANLADVEKPAENLVGIAQSASQGAITSRQLDARPIMRSGEVLETIPGVIISQHSGEGKANQYYLRGFNLDHGTDFATTIAGMPVNMPTHAHGHGYSDLNFLIPELVSGVQYSKGPYFADQGDFSTAGAANINYASVLDRPIMRVGGGDEGFGRAIVAASPAVGSGHVLTALEVERNDGPWVQPDDYRKINGVVRYSRGDAVNGLSVTGMGYRAKWNATDQVPLRAIESNLINRFGALDRTDGGDTCRYSGAVEWQRSRKNATTKIVAYGVGYDLNLFSNFTFFLDDPVHGDQFHQADHRFVSGARASYRRIGRWGGREVQNTVGVQLRNDQITNVGLYHTEARQWRPSRRYGIEFANYYAPRPWLLLDGDVSWSKGHFTDLDSVGDRIPGSVGTVISGGATLDSLHNIFGSVRWRYFGPRALVEDNSVRSRAISLINLEAGYRVARQLKIAVDVFNVLDARHSDIDYYYTSRLFNEPGDGVNDLHLHPALPRTVRVNLIVGF